MSDKFDIISIRWCCTKPQIYDRSRVETFIVSALPAELHSWINSSDSRPIQATPLMTPIVAGMPPFKRTTDSRLDAKAILSG